MASPVDASLGIIYTTVYLHLNYNQECNLESLSKPTNLNLGGYKHRKQLLRPDQIYHESVIGQVDLQQSG